MIVEIDTESDFYKNELKPFLEQKRKLIEIELCKSILILDALERNDFSNLGESMMKEIEDDLKKIRMEELNKLT